MIASTPIPNPIGGCMVKLEPQLATAPTRDKGSFVSPVMAAETLRKVATMILRDLDGLYSLSPKFVLMGGLGLTISSLSASMAGLLLLSTSIQAQESSIQRGQAFAQSNCARCHSVSSVGDSPLPKAPPFRTLHQRYPVEALAESLAEGIRTAHRAMPEFELDQDKIDDFIAYLKSLER